MSDRAYAKVQAQQKTLSGSSAKSSLLQRTCACGQHTIAGGECEECRSEQSTLHRSRRAFEPPSAPGAVPGSSPAQENGTSFNAAFERASRFGHDFSRIPIHPPTAGEIQTKLGINKPGDEYEREADRISEQVMRMPEPRLQSACPYGGPCPKCQTEQPNQEHERLQTKRVQPSDTAKTSAPPVVHDILSSPGQPLDAKTRAFVEPRFGYDLSQVRIHTSGRAAQSARAIDAMAYTVGREIVFGTGKYAPETTEGKHLLAHELTHTIQQGVQNQTPTLVQRSLFAFLDLRDDIRDLVNKKVKDYNTYHDTISKSNEVQKAFALMDEELLSALENTLDHLSFARCVEFLGRKAPTFDELRKNSKVFEAIKKAWSQSDPGTNPRGDLVVQPHEEGGWVFLNLIDGSLSIERAKPVGGNFIVLNPAPDVDHSVVVAIFHTHPNLGPGKKAQPDRRDKTLDERDGVPDLVAGNPGTNPDTFQIYLSGPAVRKHLASEKKFPGRSGGYAP